MCIFESFADSATRLGTKLCPVIGNKVFCCCGIEIQLAETHCTSNCLLKQQNLLNPGKKPSNSTYKLVKPAEKLHTVSG